MLFGLRHAHVLLEGALLGVLPLLVGDAAELVHAVEHDVAPGHGPLGEVHRVGRAGVLRQAGEQGRLRQAELAGGDAEVVLRRGLDAVGPVAVVDEVEVALEDLVLGQLLLQRDGVLQLLELAHVVLLDRCGRRLLVAGAERGVLQRDLHVLLRERRGSRGGRSAAEVGDRCAHHALQVDAAVVVEAVVLDRDLGLAHDRRDLLSGTTVRFCSWGVAMTLPSAARMREVWASGSVVNSLGRSLKTSTPLRARAPVAPTAGITRPAASSPSTSADARNAPSRLMTPPIEVVREDMGLRVTAHSMATGFAQPPRSGRGITGAARASDAQGAIEEVTSHPLN